MAAKIAGSGGHKYSSPQAQAPPAHVEPHHAHHAPPAHENQPMQSGQVREGQGLGFKG